MSGPPSKTLDRISGYNSLGSIKQAPNAEIFISANMVVSKINWSTAGLHPLRLAVFLFCAFAIFASSCGGGKSQQATLTPIQSQEDLQSNGGAFPNPAPSTLKELSYLQPDLVNRGNQFVVVEGYPLGRVNQDQTTGVFSPDWDAGNQASTRLAFATYAFNIPGYDLEQSISFSFTQTGEMNDAWVGLANYTKDKWDWFQMPEGLTLELDFTEYLSADAETMLVLPVFMGTQEWVLEKIMIGPGFEPSELRILDGYVYENDGTSPKRNVEMSITGSYSFSATTNLIGHWVEYFVLEGQYTISPYSYSRRFFPQNRAVTVFDDDLLVGPFLDLNAQLYRVEGLVLWPNGITPMPFLDLVIGGDDEGWLLTNGDGIWSTDLPDGTYTVRPVSEGWVFNPRQREFSIVGQEITVGDFVAQELFPQRVEGFIFKQDGETPLEGVEVFIDGEYSFQKTTDIYGFWRVMQIYNGPYRITPYMEGWVFEPPFRDVLIDGEFVVLEPFIGSLASQATLSGQALVQDTAEPLAGVEILISNRFWDHSTTTGADGSWEMSGVEPGTYSVSAALERWFFTPDEFNVTVSGTNFFVGLFIGIERHPYAVYGLILDEDGFSPLGGVEVYLSGDGGYVTESGGDGYWIIPEVLEGNYQVEPYLPGRMFNPESRVITVAGGTFRVDDFFLVYHPRHMVSGFVWTGTYPNPLAGARVIVANWDFWFETSTDAGGNWQIANVLDADYFVWCEMYGYRFEPQLDEVVLDGEDLVVDPFEGIERETFMVDGFVFEEDGSTPMANVAITLDGNFDYQPVTNESGYWAVFGVFNGDYLLTPRSEGWEFAPASREINIDGADFTVGDFLGTELLWYTLDGFVYETDGITPIADVEVVAQGTITRSTTTGPDGHFSIQLYNGEYEVSPNKPGYTFVPSSRYALIEDSNLSLDAFLDSGE